MSSDSERSTSPESTESTESVSSTEGLMSTDSSAFLSPKGGGSPPGLSPPPAAATALATTAAAAGPATVTAATSPVRKALPPPYPISGSVQKLTISAPAATATTAPSAAGARTDLGGMTPLTPFTGAPTFYASAEADAFCAHAAVRISRLIKSVPDFPKPGVVFKDITPILAEPSAFQLVIQCFNERYKDSRVTHVLCCESRGFLIGAPVAVSLGAALVPARHPRRLPGDTITINYGTRWSPHTLEIHATSLHPGDRVLIVDDIVGAGHTISAMIQLVAKSRATLVDCAVLTDMPECAGPDSIFVLVRSPKGSGASSRVSTPAMPV